MKKYFLHTVIILLFVTNCPNILFAQSINKKNDALNDYFETILKDTTLVVFVAKEKINSNRTIEIFRKNWIFTIDSTGKDVFDKSLFDEKSWKKMKKNYSDKCIAGKLFWCNDNFWITENFRNKNVVLESINNKKGIEHIYKKYNKIDFKVYGFSEPIYYQNKKYVVFTVNISGFNSYQDKIIVMKKNKNKWIVTHQGTDPDLIN